MEFKQCIFKSLDGEPDAELTGIAAYKYNHLIGVICLCCGRWISAKRAIIIDQFDDGWIDIGTPLYRMLEMADEWDDDGE